MSNLPKGWVECALGDVVEYGSTDKVEPSNIPAKAWVLELEDIEKDTSILLGRSTFAERQSKSTKNRFDAGDVLYGKLRPYLNKVLRANEPGYCTTEVVPLKPNSRVDGGYLFYWLKHPTFLNYVTSVSHGLNMPRLGTEAGKAAPFVLAPLDVQRRIVKRLDELLAQSRAAREQLEAVPALVETFRQSVLAAAFRGELTADWRRKNPNVEPASKLLERIRVERRKKWEDTEFAKMKAKGKVPKDDDWKERYVDPDEVHPLELAELPATWSWVGLSEVATLQLGQRRAPEFSKEEQRPYIRAANITWKGLDVTDVKTMGFAAPESVSLLPGDVLLSEASGSPTEVGKPALWNGEIANCCFQATVLRVRSVSASLLGSWLYTAFLRNAMLGDFAAMAPGVGILHLTAERMRSWPVPLAPLEEQRVLVAKVAGLLRGTYSYESMVVAAAEKSLRLEQSLLTKAFRGEFLT